jgi:hypothetical protein
LDDIGMGQTWINLVYPTETWTGDMDITCTSQRCLLALWNAHHDFLTGILANVFSTLKIGQSLTTVIQAPLHTKHTHKPWFE